MCYNEWNNKIIALWIHTQYLKKDLFIAALALHMRFFDNKKTVENHQSYPLRQLSYCKYLWSFLFWHNIIKNTCNFPHKGLSGSKHKAGVISTFFLLSGNLMIPNSVFEHFIASLLSSEVIHFYWRGKSLETNVLLFFYYFE